jgi:hypothetical protein
LNIELRPREKWPKVTDDPLVPIDRDKLFALVEAKTPWGRAAFQRILGFAYDTVTELPLSRKLLARDLIELSRPDQSKLREIQMGFPRAEITYIGPIQELPKNG